jgi:Fur family ferric uptake transcriptional regulator
MTASHQTRPLAPATVTSALGILRADGHRISAARRLALEALFAAEGPVSAEEIAGGLEGRLPESDLAALYRNLEVLSEAGLAEHVHVAHGAGRYVLTGRSAEGWVACEGCHRLQPLERSKAVALLVAIRTATGFEPAFGHFPLVGRCERCEEGPA